MPCGAEDGLRDALGRLIETIPKQRATRGNASPHTLAAWRQRWGCDCDGASHARGGYKPDGAHRSIRAIGGHIKSLTGHAPPSCPWRALYDPIVSEVVHTVNAADEGLDTLAPDTPAIVYDALRVYLAARRAVRAHYIEQAEKERAREMEKQRRASRQKPRIRRR